MLTQLPRMVRICTACWRGVDFENVPQPQGSEHSMLYRCKDCKAELNPRQFLDVTQVRGRFGNVVGHFCSNDRVTCPGCGQSVQFETDDCRKPDMVCPNCSHVVNRVALEVFHLFDKTVPPVGSTA